MDSATPITQLLRASQSGKKEALDELLPLVYEHLRAIAGAQIAWEKPGHTLSPTAIVHEAYLRLISVDVPFEDRAHFYAVSARLIRRILVDHARAHRRDKRGGGAERVPLVEEMLVSVDSPETILAIHEALDRLAVLDRRKADIVELTYFGGLDQEAAANALSISPATLRRDLRLAKAWLFNELRQQKSS
jgi:RNA polymerase sigma-70 factor (ECF subfamily)